MLLFRLLLFGLVFVVIVVVAASTMVRFGQGEQQEEAQTDNGVDDYIGGRIRDRCDQSCFVIRHGIQCVDGHEHGRGEACPSWGRGNGGDHGRVNQIGTREGLPRQNSIQYTTFGNKEYSSSIVCMRK